MSVSLMDRLQQLQEPVTRYLWTPADAITFTPQVLKQPFGDGRALFAIGTINSRPAYWIVAGDSAWECGRDPNAPDDAPYIAEEIEDILLALEAQFGSADLACPCGCCDYEWSGNRLRCPRTGRFLSERDIRFPTVNYGGGCHWCRIDWPDEIALPMQPHPYDGRTKILARTPKSKRPKHALSPEDQR